MAPKALFVIDIQEELAGDLGTQIPHASRIKEAGTKILADARKVIDMAREKDQEPPLSIIIVQHEEKPEDGTMIRGSKPWDLIFSPREGDEAERVVGKTTRTLTAFARSLIQTDRQLLVDTFESNPDLAEQLKADGVQEIIAFGIQSECCVLGTSKGAIAAGFGVTLLKGAHSTYDTDTKKADEIEKDVEEELKAKGATLVNWFDYKM
jgi:nicotinamidase-related amidase